MNERNFQKELDRILEDEENRGKKLFLHSCCAPCSSYVLTYLRSFFRITVFYYNPNITSDEEYRHRVAEQKRLIGILNEEASSGAEKAERFPIGIVEGDHDVSAFYEAVKGLEKEPEGGARCAKCFELRLLRTAEEALREGADYFSTTLTISPLKNAKLINAVGERIGKEKGISFLPSDFKKKEGYKSSIELSKKYELYRQDYCGCEYSRRERNALKTGENL